MKRDIYKNLMEWKHDPNRRPLIMRGARQVGKTYIINQFGEKEFDQIITLNFEKNPEYKEIFTSYDPGEIIERISLYTGKRIETGKTILFFDEVQECPSAITALRYFYEEMQSLHVLAAGSLLEFTLESENFRMPVGRIQYIYLFPLSFGEFLESLDEGNLREYLMESKNLTSIPEALHSRLNEYLKKYFIIGGMPAVINEYLLTHDMITCQRIQRVIIDNFLDDFGKYAKKFKHRYLQKIFNAAPSMVGRKFIYSHVDNKIKSRELKEALELLEMAGVVSRVKRTSGAGIPLEVGVKESYFKILFMDIGLFHAISGIYTDTVQAKDYTALFKGAVTEQFVGQEFLSYQNPYTKYKLYYWGREAKNSNAELDYLIQKDSQIIPIEVKSGSIGRMKSLQMFMNKYSTQYGVKISQERYSPKKPILTLPLYGIEGFIKSDLNI